MVHSTHLVVVSSLLDKLVDYFLSLTVTLLLQVTDERVQVAWTVVRLYDGLMSLNNTSYPCKHKPTCCWSLATCEGKSRNGFLLTFQQQSQCVCKYQQSSFLAQIASRCQQQVLLSFGGKLCEQEGKI